MSKYGREQNNVIICSFDHKHGHRFLTQKIQSESLSLVADSTLSNDKQSCSQRLQKSPVITFPLLREIIFTSFSYGYDIRIHIRIHISVDISSVFSLVQSSGYVYI